MNFFCKKKLKTESLDFDSFIVVPPIFYEFSTGFNSFVLSQNENKDYELTSNSYSNLIKNCEISTKKKIDEYSKVIFFISSLKQKNTLLFSKTLRTGISFTMITKDNIYIKLFLKQKYSTLN